MTIWVAALAAVLGLIWVIQRCLPLRRFSAPGRLRLVQSLPIDPRRRVVLLQCDGRDIVLLTGGPNDLLLAGRPGLAAAVEIAP